MRLVLNLAHWTGGGLDPFLDMECDTFMEWALVGQELQQEEARAWLPTN